MKLTPIFVFLLACLTLNAQVQTQYLLGLTSPVQANIDSRVLDTGDTMTGNLQFSGTTIPGLRPNNLTAVQIGNLVAPPVGSTVFNTTSLQLNMWDGSVWNELRTGNYLPLTGGTMSGATVYNSGTITASQPNRIVQRWNNAGVAFNGLEINITSDANLSSTFLDCYDDTNRRFWVTSGGSVNASQFIAGADVIFLRDSANTFGQRNGVNAQTYNLYGTYTDASNYRRLRETMTTGGAVTIASEGLGTGATGNSLAVSVDGTTRLSIASTGIPTFTTDQLRLSTFKTPSSASDTGTAGTICYDANFIYICTAANTWKRVAIATW